MKCIKDQEVSVINKTLLKQKVEVDENDNSDSVELPGADLSDESLTVRVLPKQADEFTCIKCFLVMHRSRIAKETKGKAVCSECA